jgi:hypothetical protein
MFITDSVFECISRTLLILGEPGFRKTVTLLEFVRSLLELTGEDDRQPVPLVLSLSQWSNYPTKPEDWVAYEFVSECQVPECVDYRWLSGHRIVRGDLLHGDERRVWGDSAYTRKGETIGVAVPHARHFTLKKAIRYSLIIHPAIAGKPANCNVQSEVGQRFTRRSMWLIGYL